MGYDRFRRTNRASGATELGTFTYPITLHSATGGNSEEVEALVDTGSTFSVLPATTLERLGIAPHRSVRLRLANGVVEERRIGNVTAEINGDSQSIICVFGEADSPAIIGAVTLESFLLGVDPVEQRLLPVEGYWL
jgi:predicted aspartyl protease